MAAPALRSVGTYKAASTATSFAIPAPAGVQSGDIVLVHFYQDVTAGTLTITPPAGFALITPSPTTTGSEAFVQYTYWKLSTGSEPASYTFTASGSTYCEGVATAWSGSSGVIAQSNGAARSTSATTTPAVSLTTTDADVRLVFIGINWNWGVWSGPSGYTQHFSAGDTGATLVASVAQPVAGPTGDVTATNASSASESAFLVALASNAPAFSGSATGTLRLAASETGGKNASGSVTASALRLAASESAAKDVPVSPTGTLRLAASESAAKDVAVTATATALKLSASEVGVRINVGVATMILSASTAATAHHSAAADTATLRLNASSADSSVRSNTAAATALKLSASAAQTSARSGTGAPTLHLTASESAAKDVPASLSATLRLLASESATKNVPVAHTAVLRLLTSLAGLTGTHGAANTATALRLSAITSDTGSVRSNTAAATALHLTAVANGTHIVVEVVSAQLTARAQITVPYELVCVARIPQTSGAPSFLQVDPIDYTGLSFTQELSKPDTLSAGTKITSLTAPVLQRLRNLAELATELWLYRSGKLVFAGPLLGWQIQGEALTFQAQGLLAYLKMMIVASDQVFTQVDQFTIAATLIDQWQSLDYGNFGIDTSGVGTSGVLRDATYLKKELHNVGQRIFELGQRDQGFDITIDPATRKLQLAYPYRGLDRSSGEDAIVFDSRNVTSPNVIASAAPGDVASEAFGTATSGSGTLYSVQSNLVRRAQYGRTAVAATFDNVTLQPTLDAHTLGYLDVRDEALLIPGPDTRVTPDADLSAYDVGDTVSYQLHDQLGLSGAFRLRKRTVKVSKTGQETVSVAFA